MTLHVAHNIALLQVMMTRAALSLRNAPLIDNVTATRDATEHQGAYEMQSPKPSAQLQAFMRIASEFRHFTNMLQPRDPAKVSIAEHLNHTSRTLADTALDPDHQDLMHPDALTTLNPTQRLMADAIHYAATGDQPGTLESFRKAGNLESAYEATRANPNNGALYPTANRIAEETVKTLINQMKVASPPQQEMKLKDEETGTG